MAHSDTDRIALAQPRSGEGLRPTALTSSLDSRNRRRRAVWYSILCVLIVAGLMLPFVFTS